MARTRRKKKRTHVQENPDLASKKDPRTFIFRKGRRSTPLADLEMDLRRMMQPNTAMNLKETRRNTVKDFVQVAGPLGVTHLLILTATERASYLRVVKSPQGPTLTMRIHGFSLMRDVQAAQSRPRAPPGAFASAPLVVLSGFSAEEHLKLASVLFQAMFPAIHVKTARLSACQRVVLLSRDKDTGLLTLRHYTISVVPSGVRKSVKGLLTRRALPDLGRLEDVAEFITKSGYGSESEGEDAEASRVSLTQDVGRGNAAGHTSRVRLHEIGPRLELEVFKIESGLCGGQVLYHSHVAKTIEEAAALKIRHEERAQLKASRRRQQEENVRHKEAIKKMKADAAATEKVRKGGKVAVQKQWAEQQLQSDRRVGDVHTDNGFSDKHAKRRPAGEESDDDADDDNDDDDDDDDDAAYFEREVGHVPEDTDMIGSKRLTAERRHQPRAKRHARGEAGASKPKFRLSRHKKARSS